MSSGLVPGAPFCAVGVVAGFAGPRAVGLESEFRPAGGRPEFWALWRFVLSRGREEEIGRSRASGGDLAGKLMTCSRKGTE